jgi:phage/plasmid-like protein (TIGR03299 family)
METQIQQILQDSGLDWTVRTEGLVTIDSDIVLPDKIAIIRDDNDVPLGDHKSGYVPIQNSELLEILFKISAKTGLALHKGGSFGDGEKVFFQLKSDDLRLKNDKIEGFISGFNSFDGSTSLSFGTSNLTVSCMNTFWKVYRSMQTKMKHSASIRPKIEEILKNIDRLIMEEKETFKQIERLSEIKMSDEVKEMVLRKMFDLDKEERLDSDEISTNKKNKMDRFYIDLKGELATKDDSLWGLFSGVTKYTTHSMKKTDNTEAKIFGRTGDKERQIWNELVALV